MKKRYVEFHTRKMGIIAMETDTLSPTALTIPYGCFRLRFLERTELMHEGELLSGTPNYLGETYYLGLRAKLSDVRPHPASKLKPEERSPEDNLTFPDPDSEPEVVTDENFIRYTIISKNDIVLNPEGLTFETIAG